MPIMRKLDNVADFKESFFSERSIASDYWAGYIMAKGSFPYGFKTFRFTGTDLNRMRQAEEFLGQINYERPIVKNKYCWHVEISNRQIVSDLRTKYNIHGKQKDRQPPDLDNPLAFIAGLLDGDSTLYDPRMGSRKDKDYRFTYVGTSYMATWVREVLQNLTHINLSISPNRAQWVINKTDITGNILRRLFMPLKQLELPYPIHVWSPLYDGVSND